MVLTTSAGRLDGYAAQELLAPLRSQDYPRIQKVLGDNAYGKCGLPAGVDEHGYYGVEITGKDPAEKGFQVVQWRWIVERTHAGIGRYRRHRRDEERRTDSSEALIEVGSIHRMLNLVKKSKCVEHCSDLPKKPGDSFGTAAELVVQFSGPTLAVKPRLATNTLFAAPEPASTPARSAGRKSNGEHHEPPRSRTLHAAGD
jgi:hypothetical protein